MESEATSPSTVRWCNWSCSASDRFAAPNTIATARCTSTPARSRQPAAALDRSTFASASVSPARSVHRRSSTAPACPINLFPSATTRSTNPLNTQS